MRSVFCYVFENWKSKVYSLEELDLKENHVTVKKKKKKKKLVTSNQFFRITNFCVVLWSILSQFLEIVLYANLHKRHKDTKKYTNVSTDKTIYIARHKTYTRIMLQFTEL